MISDQRKTCRICCREIHISSFRPHSSYADGYENTCKVCKARVGKKEPKPDPIAGLMKSWRR